MSRETQWMERALALAERALEHGEVPVGAVVVDSADEVIGEGHDAREIRSDPTAHAEIVAMRMAAERLGSWNLEGCTLVVTLEPCAMCAGAAILARIRHIIHGAASDKGGACGSRIDLLEPGLFNHTVTHTGGVLADRAAALLQTFFQSQRD